MKTKLITNCPDYWLLIGGDIQFGDYFWANEGFRRFVEENTSYTKEDYPFGEGNGKFHHKSWKSKVIGHLPKNNAPLLEGIPLLEESYIKSLLT